MSELEDALTRSRAMIEEALDAARVELDELDARRAELVQQIASAEMILAGAPQHLETSRQLTLHNALVRVLEDHNNEWMTARELADEVTRRGLYRKRDGNRVDVNQIHARTNNYSDLFEKTGPNIRLKEGATVLAPADPNLVVFKDDDDGFFEWQASHPDGHFINTERKPNPNYLVLHLSGCPHFKGSDTVHWTKGYVKVCSDSRLTLTDWAAESLGGDVTLCRTCFG